MFVSDAMYVGDNRLITFKIKDYQPFACIKQKGESRLEHLRQLQQVEDPSLL